MGAGALAVKPLLAHAAITFIAVEALLGIIGGLSAAALYVVFAFVDGRRLDLGAGGEHRADRRPGRRRGAAADDAAATRPYRRPADTGRTLANLNAADYLGALIGGLVWPFPLLPHLGMIRGAAATGIVNLVAAAVVAIFLLRRVVSRGRW